MDHNLTLQISETINASVTTIWKALTDKNIVKKYFYGTELDTEWEVGKSIYFRGSWEGTTYEDKGTVLEFEKEKKLTYNYWSAMSGMEDKPENYAIITYVMKPVNNATVLQIIQKGFKSKEDYEHSIKNWASVLKSLKQVVEEN